MLVQEAHWSSHTANNYYDAFARRYPEQHALEKMILFQKSRDLPNFFNSVINMLTESRLTYYRSLAGGWLNLKLLDEQVVDAMLSNAKHIDGSALALVVENRLRASPLRKKIGLATDIRCLLHLSVSDTGYHAASACIMLADFK